MTRFARAKGSKASNERVPEQATPWNQMKKQLLEKNQENEEAIKKQQVDKKREKNYKAFLEEMEEEKTRNTQWAEFPTKKPKAGKKPKFGKLEANTVEETNNNKIGKKKKNTNNEISQVEVDQQNETETTICKETKSDKVKLKKGKKNVGQEVGKKKKTESEIKQQESEIFQETSLDKTEQKKKKKIKMQGAVIKRKLDEPETKINKKPRISEEESASSNKNLEKKKVKAPKVVAQKKGVKQKVNQNEGKLNKPKNSIENTSKIEEDVKKIEKKTKKKLRQLEKKKLKKENESSSHSTAKLVKLKSQQKPERRKKFQETMIINDKEVPVAYMDGFPIKKEDADRIIQLRRDMISKGLPRSEIRISLKLERRKAEKAFTRERKKVCYNCRKSGHNLSECPEIGNQIAQSCGTGICFKCGSTEHTHFECKVVRGQEFKFAQCFICHEQGHIARQCPDNARGLYPKGGACNVCGDVTHLKKDCPKYQAQQQQLEQSLQIETMNSNVNPDNLGNDEEPVQVNAPKRFNKIVKF